MTNKQATAKQQRFAELILAGATPSDAYRGSYDTSGRPETIAVEASRLLKNPHVTLIIERGRAEAMKAATCTRMGLLARLEAVNRAACERLTDTDSENPPRASDVKAFLETFDRLKDDAPDDRFSVVASDARRSQYDGDWAAQMMADMNAPTWFSDFDWDSIEVEPLPDGAIKTTKRRVR